MGESSRGELRLRVYSALVLAPLALGSAYLGGLPFAIVWSLAAIGILWEWISLVAGKERRTILLAGGSALALSLALAAIGYLPEGVLVLAAGAVGIAAMAPAGRRGWVAGGLPYAGAIGLAPIVLRSDDQDGIAA